MSSKIAGHTLSFWEATAFYLAKEKKRHLKDIERIDEDLAKLEKIGIPIPDPPADLWIEVPD